MRRSQKEAQPQGMLREGLHLGGASWDLLSVLGLCRSPAVPVSVSRDGVSQVSVGKPVLAY